MLTPVQQYQYGTPVVMIQNKERTTRFINDYQSINHQLVRKSHPLPIIDKKIQQLEIFQYATALDLNMGYYTINILTASQDMTTIVTEFGKFIYNSLPMGMWAPGYILQAKVDDLLENTVGVKTYINAILVLRKERFSKHMEQPNISFGKLRASGLKVNATECSFGVNNIP